MALTITKGIEVNYTIGTTAPVSPQIGDLWFDTNTGVNYLKIWNGSAWESMNTFV